VEQQVYSHNLLVNKKTFLRALILITDIHGQDHLVMFTISVEHLVFQLNLIKGSSSHLASEKAEVKICGARFCCLCRLADTTTTIEMGLESVINIIHFERNK